MKKVFLPMLALTLLSIQSIAQVNAGEESKDVKKESKQEESKKSKSSSRYTDKYIHLGYFSPKMTPAEVYSTGPFQPENNPKYGLFFEKGKYRFYNDNFIFKNKGNIGLYSGTSFSYETYNLNLPESFDGIAIPFLFIDIKYGPDFRYELSEKAKLDLYGNVGLLISGGGYVADMYNPTMPAFSFQSGVGLDVSFGAFLVGGQLNFAKANYKYDVTEEANDGTGDTQTVSEQYDVLLNSFKVHIGFIFRK